MNRVCLKLILQDFQSSAPAGNYPVDRLPGACRPGPEVYSATADMPVLYATARSSLNCAMPGHGQPAGGQNPGGFSDGKYEECNHPGGVSGIARRQRNPAMENSGMAQAAAMPAALTGEPK